MKNFKSNKFKQFRLTLFFLLILITGILSAKILPSSSSSKKEDEWIKKIEFLEKELSTLMKNKPEKVPEGSLVTISYHLIEAKKFLDKEKDYALRCIEKANAYIERAKKNADPLEGESGMVTRAYKSPFSLAPQGYSLYVPKNYSKDHLYGLVLNLHGGSSNHNLFLAVTLGNWNIPWDTYWQVRHNIFYPQLKPEDYIVATPDGFGQIRWRWMAEHDVLSVIRDIRLHYSIDPKRIALCGLSNGGIGAYSIGTRYASQFSAVFSMAGISDWLLFHKSSQMADWSIKINQIESAINYAMNAKNTYYHFVHGERDAGPMKVIQARAMHKRLQELGIEHVYQEIPDMGHDIIWVLWGKGRIFNIVDKHPKNQKPHEVWLETLSYRASRQHWLELKQMEKFLLPARIKAKITDSGDIIEVSTENVESFAIYPFESPLKYEKKIKVVIDSQSLELKNIPQEGRIIFSRIESKWKIMEFSEYESLGKGHLRKKKGLSGPITDINYEKQIHVYGSQVPAETKALKEAAILGARNWMKAKQFVEVEFPVKSDEEIREEDFTSASIVLYGTFHNNKWIQKLGNKVPIKILESGIEYRGNLLNQKDVGAVFIYPNPIAPENYIMFVTGNSLDAVLKGNGLLPFLPDYIIFDRRLPRISPGMAFSKKYAVIGAGFFNEFWELKE